MVEQPLSAKAPMISIKLVLIMYFHDGFSFVLRFVCFSIYHICLRNFFVFF